MQWYPYAPKRPTIGTWPVTTTCIFFSNPYMHCTITYDMDDEDEADLFI
jgi:hypothetical protein